MKIQVRINEEGALKNQRYAFTDRYTLLSELMQNARRAGASEVRIDYDRRARMLSVLDDGSGIDDFQTLLTFSESGWDSATRDEERPFGVGFSKCLYAATRCVVNSRGHQIDFETEAALMKHLIDVVSVRDQPGTSVVLYGVELPELAQRIKRLCWGFPIPVVFNGKSIERPYAIDQMGFADTEIGQIHVAGTVDGAATRDTLVFLQGFCVLAPLYCCENPNVVHLDPRRFIARLPDRDKLIDEEEQRRHIEAAIAGLWRSALQAHKEELDAFVFADLFFAAARLWDAIDVFNDVPVLPREICSRITGYPYRQGCDGADYLGKLTQALTREAVEAGEVRLCDLEAPHAQNMALWMFARARDFVIVRAFALDRQHWVRAHVRDFSGSVVEVDVVSEEQRAAFDGRWISCTVVLCEAYGIRVDGERVEIRNDAMACEDENRALVPAGECSGNVVRQISDYIDATDHWREDDLEHDTDAMAEFITHLRSVDPDRTLRSLIAGLRLERYPLLQGKSFRVTIGSSQNRHAIEVLA